MNGVGQGNSSYTRLCGMVYALCRVKTWKDKITTAYDSLQNDSERTGEVGLKCEGAMLVFLYKSL